MISRELKKGVVRKTERVVIQTVMEISEMHMWPKESEQNKKIAN